MWEEEACLVDNGKPQQTCKPLEAVEAVVEDGRMDDGGMNG